MTGEASASRAAGDGRAPVVRLPGEPDWLSGLGTSFTVTTADAAAFKQDYNAHLRRRAQRSRGMLGRLLDGLGGAFIVASGAALIAAVASLAAGVGADPAANMAVGVALGAGASVSALFALGIGANRRASDPNWTLTTIRVGVADGALWMFKHGALTIFTSPSAFVEVVGTDRQILAFVNRTAAHAFPLGKLAADAAGREVLGWFERNLPASAAGAASGSARRWRAFRRSLAAAAVVLALIAAATYVNDRWTEARDARLAALQSDLRARAASASGAGRPPPPTLSGRDATDFVDHIYRK